LSAASASAPASVELVGDERGDADGVVRLGHLG
jgi:hypothetical protein